MKPIEGMVPPGGWHFIDQGVTLTGEDFESLVRTVQKFRVENGYIVGNVAGEVTTYLCTRAPRYCHGTEHLKPSTAPMPLNNLMDDVGQWARNLLYSKTKYALVNDTDAENRAVTCARCPNNLPWTGACSSCVATVERNSAAVRQGRDTPTSRILGGCSKMRFDNRSAVFINSDTFTDKPALPENCWLA